MKRWREYFQRKVIVPSNSKFIQSATIRQHRLHKSGNPVLILTIRTEDGVEKYALHDGLAWQLVRMIRKEIGFSESELDAAQYWGRWSGGE